MQVLGVDMVFDWYCEKLQCHMMRVACDKRRALADQTNAVWPMRYFECRGCEQKKERTLVTKKCNKCGEEKPIDKFTPHKDCLLGVEGTCRECKQKNYNEKNAGKSDRSLQIMVDDVKLPATSGDAVIAERKSQLSIDFTGYPEILERVWDLSKTEFRTPELQVLYLIKSSL